MSAPTFRESVAAGCVMAALALCMFALAQQLDDSGIESEVEIAQAVEEEAAALASREWVARNACKPEGYGVWVSDTQIQCYMHNGKRTGGVVVAGGRP